MNLLVAFKTACYRKGLGTLHTDLCADKKIKSRILDLGYGRVFFLTHISYLMWQINCRPQKM